MRRFVAAAVGLGLVMAACSANQTFQIPDQALGSIQESASSGSGEGQYMSAVDRSLAAIEMAQGNTYGTEEFGLTMEQLTTAIEEVEQLIGECMARAGFEYLPVDFSTVRKAMTSDKTEPGLSGSEYRAQYGHGITTQPDKPIVRIGLGDRNREILDGLSPTDQVAYERTLFGEDKNATFAYALESENFSRTGGCTREAVEQIFSPEELAVTYFNPADAYVLIDPRAQKALDEYAACMSAAGFAYPHPDDIDFDLQIRYDSILQGRDPEELTAAESEALQMLQDEEIAVVAANHTCETNILEPVLDRIEEELFG